MTEPGHDLIYALLIAGIIVGSLTALSSFLLWRAVNLLRDAIEHERDQVGAFIKALDPASVHQLVGVHTRRLENHEGRITALEAWRRQLGGEDA